MTLSDVEKRGARGPTFPTDLGRDARTFWHRMIKFGMVTPVGPAVACFNESAIPHPKELPQRPPPSFLGPPIYDNQLWHGDQTRWEKKLHGRLRAQPRPKNSVIWMLMRDLFAVANLLVMPHPTGWEHYALMTVVCLSVCLSVRLSRAGP